MSNPPDRSDETFPVPPNVVSGSPAAALAGTAVDSSTTRASISGAAARTVRVTEQPPGSGGRRVSRPSRRTKATGRIAPSGLQTNHREVGLRRGVDPADRHRAMRGVERDGVPAGVLPELDDRRPAVAERRALRAGGLEPEHLDGRRLLPGLRARRGEVQLAVRVAGHVRHLLVVAEVR